MSCDEPPPALLLEGIAQFNRGEFFEQHETLEVLWRAETRDIRYLYQGILQNALIEVPDVACLGAPQHLEGLVLLEELAAIELRDAFEQQRGRRFVAGHAVILRGDREAAIEDSWM